MFVMEQAEDAGWKPTRVGTEGREVISEKVKGLINKVGAEIV